MKIVATMPARNEGWIIGASARVALQWVDALIVLQHGMDSGTACMIVDLSREYGERVIVMGELNPEWNEAEYRQRMLGKAREEGATHIALIDADEMLTANLLPRIRTMAEQMTPAECLKLPWIQAWRSIAQYRADETTFGRARVPCLFRNSPELSFQPRAGNYQIHTRIPKGAMVRPHLDREDGGVLHFQHANWDALLAKQALYKMVERLRWPHIGVDEINNRYNGTVNEDGLQLKMIPDEWVDYRAAVPAINVDREPWQRAECKRLWEQHGAKAFEGLDLFGVVG